MAMQNRIRIPNNWGPRPYQMNVWRYLEQGGKRAICIWHRRAGKDDVCLHWAADSMIDKPATYWHMLPAYSQGRKAIWTAVNPHTASAASTRRSRTSCAPTRMSRRCSFASRMGRHGRCWAPTGTTPRLPWGFVLVHKIGGQVGQPFAFRRIRSCR